MPFDPNLPAANTAITSAEMRSQLTGLQSNITTATADKVTQAQVDAAIAAAITGTAVNPSNIQPLNINFSNPPTDSQIFELQTWLNDLRTALYRAP